MSGFLFYVFLSSLLGGDLPAQVSHPHNAPLMQMRKLEIQPPTPGLQLKVPEGTLLDDAKAHSIAQQAQQQLRESGFLQAEVDSELTPVSTGKADLHLMVKAGEHVRVKEVEFTGDLGLTPKELRGSLRELHERKLLPWWRILPSYNADAVQADLTRVRSLYLSKGYFDATVRLDDSHIEGKDAHIRIAVNSGQKYTGMDASAVCTNLLAQRREAQSEGVLEFTATLHVKRFYESPNVQIDTSIDRGQPYHIGRIELRGHRHYSEETLRRNLLIEEGGLMDETLLRKSIARLDRLQVFEPIDANHITIRNDPATGIADVGISLTERKRGAWSLSGPVGPPSLAGALEASIGTRLPSWGFGLLDMSSYVVTFTIAAFAPPILPVSILPKRALIPVFAFQRPFTPGEGWKSGFSIIPQLGWKASALIYPITQIQQRVLPLLAGDRGLVTELPVSVDDTNQQGVMYCAPPKPRFSALRDTASIAIRLAGSLTGL